MKIFLYILCICIEYNRMTYENSKEKEKKIFEREFWWEKEYESLTIDILLMK